MSEKLKAYNDAILCGIGFYKTSIEKDEHISLSRIYEESKMEFMEKWPTRNQAVDRVCELINSGYIVHFYHGHRAWVVKFKKKSYEIISA